MDQQIFSSSKDIVQQIKNKKISAEELITTYINSAKDKNKNLGAILNFNDQAIERARKLDQSFSQSGLCGDLMGVPIVVKDNICTDGLKTTAGSKILSNFIPPYSATLIQRLEEQGAIVIGKANLDEFGMGSKNQDSGFYPCKNPHDLNKVPGGSSGGSAAAVASGMCPISIGTDTGGSIRLPASHCGVFGFKPTYGLVSRYGVISYASSFDQAGPISFKSEDLKTTLKIMGGRDPMDATCVYQNKIQIKNQKKKIGILSPVEKSQLSKSVLKAMNDVKMFLENEGYQLEVFDMPEWDHTIAVYYLLAVSEASSNLSRYDGIRYGVRKIEIDDQEGFRDSDVVSLSRGSGFGWEVKKRIIMGTFSLSAGFQDKFFIKAAQIRRKIFNSYQNIFSNCDYILLPNSSSTAEQIEDNKKLTIEDYQNDLFNIQANLIGSPSVSIPIGRCELGMPVGVQLMGPSGSDYNLIDLAMMFEKGGFTSLEVQNV